MSGFMINEMSGFYIVKESPWGRSPKGLSCSKDDQVVVKSIIDVAKGMGVKTVAEFVETQESLDLLKEWGIDYAQGYLIGKPDPDPKF